MDRGIPTEAALAELRASDPPVQYLPENLYTVKPVLAISGEPVVQPPTWLGFMHEAPSLLIGEVTFGPAKPMRSVVGKRFGETATI
jgi:hypothetical protein